MTSGGTTVTHTYDANGSLTPSSDGRTVSYAAFGKAASIAKGSRTSAFAHGPDRARFKRVDTDGGGNPTTTLYLGSVEKVAHPDGTVTVRRRIGGTAIEVEGSAVGSCEADALRYVLRDHLGSADGLANAQGALVQPMSFAAWGARRDPDDWTGLAGAAAAAFDACATTRGFTGHEMLDAVGAVHMNGRIYDPALRRFLRADPFVQFPASLQSHNRYSYALNNPLAYTDPSGHFIFSLAATAYLAGAKAGITTIVATVAAAGFGDALIQGASFGQALRAGFLSGVSAAAFSGIGSGLEARFSGGFAAGLSPVGFGLKVALHGTVGGITSTLGGGRFGHGFASAGFTALGTSFNNSQHTGGSGFSPLRVALGAAIGGTASRITGGKFANGAVTGAFSQAFNQEQAEERAAGQQQDPEAETMADVTRTERKNGILYEREDGASVLVQNNDVDGEIPDVNDAQVIDALAVSAQEGQRLQIISGYREGSIAHRLHGGIDVHIKGYTTEETARALHRSGRFNRVSSYTGELRPELYQRTNTAHADYYAEGNQGLFEDWIHQRD